MTGAERGRHGLAIAALLFGVAALAAAAEDSGDVDPLKLLDRMDDAVRELSYEGRIVVQGGSVLNAFHITHRFDAGAEHERVVSLTGEFREIVRSGDSVACLTPGSARPINVDRRTFSRTVSPLQGVDAEELARYYDIRMLEPGRVAGREAYQVRIAPRDRLRYGHRLMIDRETALPLHNAMLEADDSIRSQVMFVDLEVGAAVPPDERESLPRLAAVRTESSLPLDLDRLMPPAWTFDDVPPGFRLHAHRRTPVVHAQGVREHFIFSDGLATVSVYVQPRGEEALLTGERRLGSAHAVGHTAGEHEIIAVGEVPMQTLHLFVEQIRNLKP
jgi:sigma-E factor negative regulatory protein RseB